MASIYKVVCAFVVAFLCSLLAIEAAPQNGRRRGPGRRRNGGGRKRVDVSRTNRVSPFGFRAGVDQDGFGRYGRDLSHVLGSIAAAPQL